MPAPHLKTKNVAANRMVDWVVDDDETALLSHAYQIVDILERSPICTLYRATHRNTSKTFTIKSIDLRRYLAASGLSQEDIEREVEVCASLKHPFFCQLKDVIYGSNALHMVFEHVEGSDICFEIVRRASSGFIYSEAVASHYIRQLVEAIQYLHSQNIVHRDLRPHNILLANKDNNAALKLRGFGIAHRLNSLDERCPPGRIGIPQFMAPEVVAGHSYGKQVDMWNVGIVLFILLSGRLPFYGSIQAIYECITQARFCLSTSAWNTVSEPAKDLVRKLLTISVEDRLTAEQCLRHPWISDKTLSPRVHLSQTVDNIRKYNFRRKLKSNIIAAANNTRWNRFPVNSYLSADSMPGGDACDFDCSLKKQEASSGEDMYGVQMVLSSLDKMSVLSDYSISAKDEFASNKTLESALKDQQLHELLLLYDRIRSHGIRPSPVNRNAEQKLSEAKEEVVGGEDTSAETNQLLSLLGNVHLQAILQAQDIVIEEVFASSATALDSSSRIEEAIQIGRMPLDMISQNMARVSIAGGTAELDENEEEDPSSAFSAPHNYQNTGKLSAPSAAATLMGNGSIVPLYSDSVYATTSKQPRHNSTTSNLSSLRHIKNAELDAHDFDEHPLVDDDDDLLMNEVSRVRLIQFQKDTEEPMGITLKVTEDKRCFIARIMHGGMIHRQSTLHVGDEIREINNQTVAHQSVEALQRMLRDARGHVQFKIVPSYRSAPPACEIFVRAQFDYDPSQDDLIPCTQAGVPFKTGDILQIISKDDHNWWQARFVSSFPGLGGHMSQPSTSAAAADTLCSNASTSNHLQANKTGEHGRSTIPNTSQISSGAVAGLIPSPELQEWRTACLAMESVKDNSCMWFNKKKKYYTTKYLRKHSDLFEQLDLVTYEEVLRLSSFRRKTLVLLGAHGVGRRHIKNTLIHRHHQRFAYPIPHTTRPARKDEIDGKHYFFVTNDVMLADIQANEYLEYGTHEDCLYGTKLETIRAIHRSGKMAILDVEPQALKVLRSAEYAPFVVFISAPNLQGILQDPDGSLEKLLKDSEVLKQAFGHLFDYVICNNDIDDTIHQLEVIVEKLGVFPQWVPVSWVY